MIKLQQKIANLFPEVEADAVHIEATKNAAQGDYTTNFAMKFAKQLGKNPQELAKHIQENIDMGGIDRIEIAGPGFINIFLKSDSLTEGLENVEQLTNIGNGKTIIVDYSSPNIAKKMHIAHLRSTAIGDSIKRIYKSLGYNAFGINHVGDWGTQFGKLIVGYNMWLDKEAYAKNPIDELERIYVKFANESKDDKTLEDKARAELVKVQQKEEVNYNLWKEFIALSLEEYAKIYKRLGVEIEHTIGESFYNDMMADTTKLLMEKGIAKKDDGAIVVFFDEAKKMYPAIVEKSDGAFGYTASDVSSVIYRTQKWNPEKMLYVVDARQADHFKQVFEISRMLGITTECEHVAFGVMSTEDGALSTRNGNIIRLELLLDEGFKRAYETVCEKSPELSEEQKEEIARTVSVGAIKYFDLSQNRTSDIIFSWDKALSFEGNTSSYLQYTYSRIKSLIANAGITPTNVFAITNDVEKEITIKLKQFNETVVESANKARPNILATYLFELAQLFNSLYNKVNFINDKENLQARVNLSSKVSQVLKTGLDLLGINTLERM